MKQTKVFWGYVILTSIITLLWTGYMVKPTTAVVQTAKKL